MTEVGTGEALNLDELRELVKLARHRLTVHPSDGWAGDFADNVRALVAEVERLSVERDRARDVAVALEQQTAEALRIAREALDGVGDSDALARFEDALEDVVRLLGDDETETQQ